MNKTDVRKIDIGQTRITVHFLDEWEWEYRVRSADPGIKDVDECYHKTSEEAVVAAVKHVKDCVEQAIAIREKELEMLKALKANVSEVQP